VSFSKTHSRIFAWALVECYVSITDVIGDWSTCSATCGIGYQTRTTSCGI